MLHDLVTTNREAIIASAAEIAAGRPSPVASELAENGIPRFLSQLSQTLLIEGPVADEYYFRCNACDRQWSEHKPPDHSERVRTQEAS